MNNLIITVSQLNRYAKSLLEDDKKLSSVFVQGEISNFKLHSMSGHAYFSLKDNNAIVRCVCFKDSMSRIKFDIKDGMKVLCQGRISLYEKDGTYQLYVYSIKPDGVGENALALEQLKEKLASEGLFALERKRKLPRFPHKIAVVTSSQGAAIKDICNIIERRYPICEVLICSVNVQGIYASGSMVAMLDNIYKYDDIDVVIIARGGGASEDLSAFNNEELARKVASSPVPVISAVGHETDFTICDFVADLRVPTPSAAAELCVPDMLSLLETIKKSEARISKIMLQKLNDSVLRLDLVTKSKVLSNINNLIDPRKELLEKKYVALDTAYTSKVNSSQERLTLCASKLDTLSPLKTMIRGYTVAYNNGKIVRSHKDASSGDDITIKTFDGQIECKVK